MACIAGRLRAARLSAALAADTPSTSAAACGLFQSSSSDFYPAWLGLPWTATRSIAASSAHHDSPAGAGGDSRRPDNTSRRRQRPNDRSDASAQRLGVGPQQPSSRAGQSRREGLAEQRPRGSPSSPRDGDSRQAARPRWDRGPGGPASASASSPRGASSPAPAMLQLQPRDPHQQQQPNPERWDLVVRNAQQRVLQLIGDPRTGVADDTTTNPFGEVTVDMVHYQPSNEVYWFKYEFAGAATHGSHRDARLSDYTRNLMYLMRAKDPKRWTIQALADKFRIRKQRVLAILALKELEAQRIEDGKLLAGPLSAYALPVRTQDIHLDPHTGNPRLGPQPPRQQQQQQPSPPLPSAEDGTPSELVQAAEVEAEGAAAAAAPRALDDHVDVVLPRVVSAAQKLQLQLVELLGQYGYDSNRIRTAFLADLDRAAEMAAAVLGGDEYLKEDLQSYRTAIEAVVAAVEEVVAASPLLLEERRAAAMRSAVDAALAAAGEAVLREATEAATTTTATATESEGGGEGAPAAAAPSEGLLAVRQKLTEILAPVLEGAGDDGGRALQRAFFTLSPKTRGSVLRLLPEISIRLSAAGVDLGRAAKEAAYRGPEAAAAASAAAAAGGSAAAAAGGSAAASSGGGALPPRQLSVDVFWFAPVPERQAAAVVSALESLEAARSALVAKVVALDPEALGAAAKTAAAAPAASDTRLARSLVRQYVATDAMWADLLAPSQSVVERRLALPSVDPARKRRMLEVLHEADPTALTRALQVEAAMQLRFRNAAAEADALAAGVGAAAAAAAAAAEPGAGQGAAGEGEAQQGQQGQQGPGRAGDVASWDALAAFLEARVAGKVYGSGSGERHVARLPTYPAFEGYSLEEFDRAGESELSALNRKLAESLDEQMYDRFRNDLLFNLGVRGEKLRLSSHEAGPWPSNLRTELTRPVVLYGINADGTTQYPPLYVATGDGRTRPLNEQEKVFQERREIRPRLPYYMGRIRRMPELE
ncbi:hypothetical protein PLESTM_000250800 [Pleodorina starrii]|nr:hypothetical protein PLESTM_000250800 [Pleodorina starrii]